MVTLLTKLNKSNAVGEWNRDDFSERVRNDYEPGKCRDHERVKGEIAKEI